MGNKEEKGLVMLTETKRLGLCYYPLFSRCSFLTEKFCFFKYFSSRD